MKIFISSTWKDLQPERKAVREAIERISQQSVGMEYFGSRPETPKRVSVSEVEKSDIYVGIFAFCYGSIDPVQGTSITELEYKKAKGKGIPCLIYFKDEQAKVSSNHFEVKPKARSKLKNLKNRLKINHTVTYFSSPHDLAAKVTADLVQLMGGQKPDEPETKRRMIHTLADFPDDVKGKWVILCAGKREGIPVSREKDLLADAGDPRELTWVFALGLPPETIIMDDKYPDFIDHILREEKRNIIAVGSPGSNLFVRQHYSDAFFRFYYEPSELQRYQRMELAEANRIRSNVATHFPRDFDSMVAAKRETWDSIKRFWKATHYALPLEREPNETRAVEYRGIVSLARHPYYDDRIAIFAGGSRFVSTIAAVRALSHRPSLRVRQLGGIVKVHLLDRRRGFDVHTASSGWHTKPYTIRQMIKKYEQMVERGSCASFGYTEHEVRDFITCLVERGKPRRRRNKK